jgi:hypothetical protein
MRQLFQIVRIRAKLIEIRFSHLARDKKGPFGSPFLHRQFSFYAVSYEARMIHSGFVSSAR